MNGHEGDIDWDVVEKMKTIISCYQRTKILLCVRIDLDRTKFNSFLDWFKIIALHSSSEWFNHTLYCKMIRSHNDLKRKKMTLNNEIEDRIERVWIIEVKEKNVYWLIYQ